MGKWDFNLIVQTKLNRVEIVLDHHTLADSGYSVFPRRLVSWHDERCSWVTAVAVGSQYRVPRRKIGPSMYLDPQVHGEHQL